MTKNHKQCPICLSKHWTVNNTRNYMTNYCYITFSQFDYDISNKDNND